MHCLALATTATVLACGARTSQPGTASKGGDGSGTVVMGSELSGNFLQSLRNRVPSMSVSERSGQCPRITFRGQRSITNQQNPSVFVDGAMMLDTCILNQISTLDVERVEVFPSGNTSYPGIQRNPFGAILIFRVRE